MVDQSLEPEPDPNQAAFDAVRKLTALDPDEELLGDPKLREEYRKLKEEYERREAGRTGE